MTKKQQASDRVSDELTEIAASVRGTFQTVEEMAQSFIREAILRGVFSPGERLNQDRIAAVLGVSRMPVRASLRQLEAEGLLRIHTHRGAIVSVLRPEEIAEIYDMRVLLEGYLLEKALNRMTDDELGDLERMVVDLEAEADLAVRFELRKAFYRKLYSLADRPRALRTAEHLRASVGRYLLIQRVDENCQHHDHNHHDELVVYLRKRDADGAKKWLAIHLGHVSEMLQAMVAEVTEKAEPA